MNNGDMKFIEAMKIIKRHCHSKNEFCTGCIANKGKGCILNECQPYMWKIPKARPNLTDVEKIILKNIDRKYRWIARDKDKKLCVYSLNPYKQKEGGEWIWMNQIGDYYSLQFPNLFEWCKWEDEEPWFIPNLLKD